MECKYHHRLILVVSYACEMRYQLNGSNEEVQAALIEVISEHSPIDLFKISIFLMIWRFFVSLGTIG